MPEHKYRFNPQTLNFERIRLTACQKVRRVTLALTPGLLVGMLGIFLVYQFVDSPKEALLKRENQQLLTQYELLNRQLSEVEDVLRDVRRRDDNIYRVIFEADPLPESMRRAGSGGVNRYRDLAGFAGSEVVLGARKRLDALTRQLIVQSESLDDVAALPLRNKQLLASIPRFFLDEEAPRPDQVDADFDNLFGVQRVDVYVNGLYVGVRHGHVDIDAPGGHIDLGLWETGYLPDGGGRPLRLSENPGFLFNDIYPVPDENAEDTFRLIELIIPGGSSDGDGGGGICEIYGK